MINLNLKMYILSITDINFPPYSLKTITSLIIMTRNLYALSSAIWNLRIFSKNTCTCAPQPLTSILQEINTKNTRHPFSWPNTKLILLYLQHNIIFFNIINLCRHSITLLNPRPNALSCLLTWNWERFLLMFNIV